MKKGLIGKKIGMTQIFDEKGNMIPVTVIEAGPCAVVQKKTTENDGYDAVQLKLIGARRFLITGLILTVISGIALVVAGVYAASLIVLVLVCLVLAVCPALSLFAIIAIIGLCSYTTLVGFTDMFIPALLITGIESVKTNAPEAEINFLKSQKANALSYKLCCL